MNIPIVGQRFQTVHWFPTALGVCMCDPSKGINLVIMTQLNQPTICSRCGWGYMIEGMDHGQPVIAFLPPMPKPEGL